VASKKKVAAAKKAAAAAHARATAVADALAAGKSQEEADAAGEAAALAAAPPKAASSEDEEETGEIDDKAPPASNASSPVNSNMATILAKLTQIPGLAAAGVNMTEIAEAEAQAQAADPSLEETFKNVTANGTFNGTANGTANGTDADISTGSAPSGSASSSVRAALLKLGVDSSNDAVASTVVSMTISMDYDWVAANTVEFKKVFAQDIAAALSIDTARCDVQSVKSGSTVVKFALLSAVSNETAEGNAEPSSSQLAETLVHMGESIDFPNLSRQSGVDMQSLKAKAIDWKVMETTDPAEQAAAATDAVAAKISSMLNGTAAAAKAAEPPASGINVSDVVDKLISGGGATNMNGAVANLQKEQGVRESNSLAELKSVLAKTGNSSVFNLTEALNSSVPEAMNGSAISLADADAFLETGRSASVRRSLGRIFASLSSMARK
jgi:hypothetical protein